jgi:IS4 transposase
LNAITIAQLYKQRWQVELFFKWIKQNLQIEVFFGQSENAVKTQIWIAISAYLLIAILKKNLNLNASLNEILHFLSDVLYEQIPIQQAFQEIEYKTHSLASPEQLSLLHS